jgi:TatD DNase family protein
VGVHPYHVNDDTEDKHHGDTLLHRIESTMQQAREMVQQYNFSDKKFIVAIGECGLDATPGFPPISDQLPWFKAQVELAQALELPLFVHERLALRETLQILDGMTRPVPVLIHCFTGGPVECHEYEQRGYSISFSGSILKPGDANEMTRQCLRDRIPSRLMIETDAPYMGFPNSRKYYLQKQESQLATLTSKQRKRLQTSLYPNVPSSLVAVLDEVVALLNAPNNGQRQPLTREEVAHQTTRNAIAFFGLDLDL